MNRVILIHFVRMEYTRIVRLLSINWFWFIRHMFNYLIVTVQADIIIPRIRVDFKKKKKLNSNNARRGRWWCGIVVAFFSHVNKLFWTFDSSGSIYFRSIDNYWMSWRPRYFGRNSWNINNYGLRSLSGFLWL